MINLFRFLVLMFVLFIISCSSVRFSSLDKLHWANGMQKFGYLVCLSSSAKYEGKFDTAYDLDTKAWIILKEYQLTQPQVVVLFQNARREGKKYPLVKADQNCLSWSEEH